MSSAKRLTALFSALTILFLASAAGAGETLPITARSAILMDMTTGRILYEKDADRPIQPASITKVLSLYLVDEALREGRVSLHDKVKISRKAGRTGGSRMFLKAGMEIPLGELVKGMAVVSANDASVAVAEYIAGSTERFVEMMNRKARELGMTGSLFRNPNGLPAKGQITTARDILTLSCEYLRKFPEALSLHSQQYYTFRRITQHNRNSLLWTYPEVDGLKTGWVVKAGYHLVATAKRGQTRLVAVVMGARSPAVRAKETRLLLDEGFRIAASGQLDG